MVIKNYKSIASCSVQLRSLVFLVGQNGSGKSNFLDALRFVSNALNSSLDHALRERSGISEVRRRSGGHPNDFAIRLDFQLPSGQMGNYSFQIGAKESGGFEEETLEFRQAVKGQKHSWRFLASNCEDPSSIGKVACETLNPWS
ncbi:MAG: AAA family ATPase [Candidatus Omnitrophica bacterium]|nr:AAA family ATPase [Candidatus Omnitrophota bacterium]